MSNPVYSDADLYKALVELQVIEATLLTKTWQKCQEGKILKRFVLVGVELPFDRIRISLEAIT